MGSRRTGNGFDLINFKYPKVRTPPLREPFHSLFQSSPREALRLLRKLCNHAITAWFQLHRRFEFTGLRHRVSIFWDSPLESLRNLRSSPSVRVTRDGTVVSGRAEIVEDAVRKRAIVTVHPFVPLAPFRIVHTLALDVFAPVTIGMLRRWVIARPIVVIHV
jgi:hypothetical protein